MKRNQGTVEWIEAWKIVKHASLSFWMKRNQGTMEWIEAWKDRKAGMLHYLSCFNSFHSTLIAFHPEGKGWHASLSFHASIHSIVPWLRFIQKERLACFTIFHASIHSTVPWLRFIQKEGLARFTIFHASIHSTVPWLRSSKRKGWHASLSFMLQFIP